MFDFSKLWTLNSIKQDETLDVCMGSLHVWIHRGKKEWRIAHEMESGSIERCSASISAEPIREDLDWTRWILEDRGGRMQLKPRLPDRPLIVRPEMPMCLMPKQSIQFFIGIPIWLAISLGAKNEQAIELPTQQLSNSWFGQFTEGELCYAMKTTAKLNQQDMLISPQRAVFPLEVRNLSQKKLNFERLCIRPQYLNIFQGESCLWTSKGRISYRGESNWSRIVYSANAPEFGQAGHLLGKARDAMQRGSLLRTFDTFKKRVELP